MCKELRTELKLHTTVSEDISLIRPGDLIRAAQEKGCKAIAVTDKNSVQSFPLIPWFLQKEQSNLKVIYGAELQYWMDHRLISVTVLAKDRAGLKALYKLISGLKKEDGDWLTTRQALETHREHLLLGWSIGASHMPQEQKRELAPFFDYLELYPTTIRPHGHADYQLGKDLGIPVVAAGNCHYIEKADRIGKEVLDSVRTQETEQDDSCLRTTREMLEAFSSLGEDAAYEVVVTNPNRIADQIERIDPVQTPAPFTLPNAREEVSRICRERLRKLYGAAAVPARRLEEELAILSEPHASLYLLAHQVSKGLQEKGANTDVRGTAGSVFLTYLLGISQVNPLPVHYRCTGCSYTDFDREEASGFDLPAATCPVCGAPMTGDGQNIPYETCMGPEGEQEPLLSINVPQELQEEGFRLIRELVGEDRVAFAGTVSTMLRRLAESYVQVYEDMFDTTLAPGEGERIIDRLIYVKTGEGRHPGGMVLLPQGMEWEDLTPLRGGATHMEFHNLGLAKLDVISQKAVTRLQRLQEKTGVREVDLQDEKVYELIRQIRTAGIPEFSGWFGKRLLYRLGKVQFSDLVKVSGLAHGTHSWNDNAEHYIREHPLRELIGTRDDIFLTLRKYGVDRKTAYKAMTATRKGKFGCYPELAQTLHAAGVPDWYLDSMKKVHYLFPKSHAVAYVKLALSLAWFKVYYPEEFYTSYLDIYRDSFPEEYLTMDTEAQSAELHRLKGKQQFDYHAARLCTHLELIQEAAEFRSGQRKDRL